MGRLTQADPVAIARQWLISAESETFAMLDEEDRVGLHNEPPYPCVVLTDVPGSDRDLRHLIAPMLQIEVLGDLDGSPGKPALRALMYTVLEDLVRLAESEQTDPTRPVVTAVVSSGGAGWVPLPTGQPRYLTTVQMFLHPATEPAE